MEINKIKEGTKLCVALDGRLDTTSAPALEETLKTELEGVTEFVLDLEKLAYISSAGLRVILYAQKTINKQGSMKIVNAGEDILDIFEITGFSGILTIE